MGLGRLLDRLRGAATEAPSARGPRLASVYLREDAVLVHPSSQTTTGLWMLAEPVTRLAASCADAELGTSVRAALRASRSGIPHPKKFEPGAVAPLLRAAKVRSYKAFVGGARLVTVDEEAGTLTLTPHRNAGRKEGFEELGASVAVVPGAESDAALGVAVRSALARAE